jgi:predicted ATPase/class 3 adenylate cyclase
MPKPFQEELPTGTITFLLTDIEGSTELWEKNPEPMRGALIRHDAIFDAAVNLHSGVHVRPRGEGDSRFAVFQDAVDAVAAAVEIQQNMATETWDMPSPLRVRIGLHTGVADLRIGDYYGSAVNRSARVRGMGHGGQTLLSLTTKELVQDNLPADVSLADMGYHTLKGLSRPENVFQLIIPGLSHEFPALKSLENLPNNLPSQTTEFIGRNEEVEEIVEILCKRSVRLLTLTGPGGTGKTRLSQESAASMLNSFPDGVYFIPLAPISDPELVPTTIARAIGVREGGGLPPLENLKSYLKDKQLLLLLDNFEQVMDATAIVSELLVAAPNIKLMVTSRIPLQVRGEQELPVSPLDVPGKDMAFDEIERIECVKMFVTLAQAANPRFELNKENSAAIAEICRRLDGLPLAIEIAAARSRMLSPQAMLKRLDKSLKLLTGGPRDLPARQQTLRGAIDWSYDLLEPDDRTLFARLGVFVGGFTLEAAEAVCNSKDQLDVFVGIETLLNNSLLKLANPTDDEPRFELLQTIREYALEQLIAMGELEEMRQYHAEYFNEKSDEIMWELYSTNSVESLRVLETEQDNFRAALHWSLESPDRIGVGIQIAYHIFWFWYRYGHFHEGRDWCERLLSRTDDMGRHPLRAMVLATIGMMAMWEGDLNVAVDYSLESLEIWRALEEPEGMGFSLLTVGVVLLNQGQDDRARPYLEESIEVFRGIGATWIEGTALVHLGNVALGQGDIEAALDYLEKGEKIARQVGDPWQIAFAVNNRGEVARVQGEYDKAQRYYIETEQLYQQADAKGDQARLVHTLAYIAQHEGDLETAEARFRESLESFLELGNKRGIAECLAGLAGLAAERGETEWAVPLLAASEALLHSFGAAWWPADRVEFERSLESTRSALEQAEFDDLWEQGEKFSLEEAVKYASGSNAKSYS